MTVGGSRPVAPSDGGTWRGEVLIVEDNDVNQRVAAAMVGRMGFRTTVAENGALALDALREQTFDIVLMDCQMPVMDGYEATRRLRAGGGENAMVPVIAVTAAALPEERVKCFASGMDDYVSKPVVQSVLAAILERFVPRPIPSPMPAAASLGPSTGAPDLEQQHRMTAPGRAGQAETGVRGRVDVDLTTGEGPADAIDLDRLAILREALDGEFESVVQSFLDSSHERMDDIEAAVSEHDADRLHRAAHSLKGSSMTFAADQLADAAHELESAPAEIDLNSSEMTNLRDWYEKTCTALAVELHP